MSREETLKNGNGNNVLYKFIAGSGVTLILLGVVGAQGCSIQTKASVVELATAKADIKSYNDHEIRIRLLEESFKKFDSKLDRIDSKIDDIHKVANK